MSTTEQPKIKLYWLDQSRSQRIMWLLEELHLEYEVEIFHRSKETKMAPPELEKIHPLGKSPVLTVTPAGDGAPIVLAESGFIVQWLCDHFAAAGAPTLVPPRWKDGQEGKVGGETEGWLRYQYLLHYSEGSLMPVLLISLIVGILKSPQVPFFIRPITSVVANKILAAFVFPNAQRHLAFLDGLLASSGGPYLCGADLSAADVLMSFPLIAGRDRFQGLGSWEGGDVKAAFPRLFEYIARLEASPGYVRSVKKIEEIEGKPYKSSI